MFIWQIIKKSTSWYTTGYGKSSHQSLNFNHLPRCNFRTYLQNHIIHSVPYKTSLRKVILCSTENSGKKWGQYCSIPSNARRLRTIHIRNIASEKNSFVETSFSIVFLLLHWFLSHFRLQHVVHTRRLRGPLSAITTADAITPLLCWRHRLLSHLAGAAVGGGLQAN